MKVRGITVGTPLKPEKNLVKATDLTPEEQAQARANIGTNGTFVAEYGVTTFAELEEAYAAEKVLYCDVDKKYRVPMHAFEEGRNVTFFRVTSDDRTNYYCSKTTGWGRAIAKHTPGAHAATHGADGSDPITPESIGAASAVVVGDIETALDSILAIQNELIGGDGE